MKVEKVNADGGAHNARAEVLLFMGTAQMALKFRESLDINPGFSSTAWVIKKTLGPCPRVLQHCPGDEEDPWTLSQKAIL